MVNDENDRRLSNGVNAEPPVVSCADCGVGIGDQTSDSGTLLRCLTLRSASSSPSQISLPSGGNTSAAAGGASSPAVSTRSSGASSTETQLDGGRGGDGDAGNGGGEYDDTTDGSSFDSSGESDVDSTSKQSAASSTTTASASGNVSKEASISLVLSLGVEEQCRQPQPRGHGDGDDKQGDLPDGRNEVERGIVPAAATMTAKGKAGLGSSRLVSVAKSSEQR